MSTVTTEKKAIKDLANTPLKDTLVDGDGILLIDSEDGDKVKRTLWSSIKAYFTGVLEGNTYYPLTGTISENTTRTISVYPQRMTVIIPKAYLIASSGGPYVLTLTTGVAGKETIKIPIAPAGTTISNSSLTLSVYIDSDGNVMSDSFTIQGTWTPLITDGTVRTSAFPTEGQYTITDGKYVHLQGSIGWSAGAAAGGKVLITGIPFTTRYGRSAGAIGAVLLGSITLAAAFTHLVALADPNRTDIYIIQSNGNTYNHLPTLNANGALYGFSIDYLTYL